MKRRHRMPFGVECRDDGSVRFRLWAPAARQVELALANSRTFALDKHDDGWFELVTNAVAAGDQYQFRINGAQDIPDPASRFQPRDVHGPSQVVDPQDFEWQDADWSGRPWAQAVIYELHVGTFSPSGTFAGVTERIDYLADLGVTAIELMPVADFPGRRNWGYDGVLPFAPDSSYGVPDDLKRLVQTAHARGIMVLLDVVYNHFGPEGNYLNSYAPQFFTDRHCTPWGNGINFDGCESRTVRDFFIHNALYWLTEYHFDGLRLDAVHAIVDDSKPHFLDELGEAVRAAIAPDRHVHLVLENERNEVRHLLRDQKCLAKEYTAQWNDDIHHALHVLVTGERDGYYSDYAERPLAQLGRCLAEGFAFQGQPSRYAGDKPRGESSSALPPAAFISFLQNHDQIGNRAFGERIVKIADQRAVRAAAAILLLAPSPPMLFMGEEFGAQTPFLFFCDFEKELAAVVTAGRRNEFAKFDEFNDPGKRQRIPDPGAATTFEASRLDWNSLTRERSQEWLRFYRRLIELRHLHVMPHLASSSCAIQANYKIHGDPALTARWQFADGAKLTLLANLEAKPHSGLTCPASQIIYAGHDVNIDDLQQGILPAWSVVWRLES
jgi:maltooligosyltrehalose trehalohydrolase